MKKFVALVLSVLILSLAGCTKNNTSSGGISSADNIADNSFIDEDISSKSESETENSETIGGSEEKSNVGESDISETSSISETDLTKPNSTDNKQTVNTVSKNNSEKKNNSSSVNSKNETDNSQKTDNSHNNQSVIENNSSSNNKNNSSSNNSNTSSNTQNNTSSKSEETENKNNSSSAPQNNYSKFDKKIGVYETKNLPSVSSYYDNKCPAWIGVYSVGKNVKTENEIKEKFNAAFGYYANESVVCTYVGKYIIDGYNEAQEIYQYTIQDVTYLLLQDEFYVIKKKICDDGSAWVGFPVPGTLYTMDTSSRVSDLLNQMDEIFCEWTGYDMKYMRSNKDKFMIDMISVAGKMRTTDGKVIDVVYRYTRGVNMPVNK